MTPDLQQFLAKAANAANLSPVERARTLRPLVDEAKTVFSGAADAAIVEALESLSASELARQLGVSPAAISKATNRYNARQRSHVRPQEPAPLVAARPANRG